MPQPESCPAVTVAEAAELTAPPAAAVLAVADGAPVATKRPMTAARTARAAGTRWGRTQEPLSTIPATGPPATAPWREAAVNRRSARPPCSLPEHHASPG